MGTTLTASSRESEPAFDLLDIGLVDIEQSNSCLSCPPLLLQVIRDVSRNTQSLNPEDPPQKGNDKFLSVVDAFDPYTWAISLQQISSSFDLDLRVHVGCAFKAAVKIYILRATMLSDSPSIIPSTLEQLVSEIILHLEFIPPGDYFFKATCWPALMAGAETNNPEQRLWVSRRFETAKQTMPWGYLSSALDLLHGVWTQKEQKGAGMDWLLHLKLSGKDWLIV
jgi:hypothetical protein